MLGVVGPVYTLLSLFILLCHTGCHFRDGRPEKQNGEK